MLATSGPHSNVAGLEGVRSREAASRYLGCGGEDSAQNRLSALGLLGRPDLRLHHRNAKVCHATSDNMSAANSNSLTFKQGGDGAEPTYPQLSLYTRCPASLRGDWESSSPCALQRARFCATNSLGRARVGVRRLGTARGGR